MARTKQSASATKTTAAVPGRVNDFQADALTIGPAKQMTKAYVEKFDRMSKIRNENMKQEVLLEGWKTHTKNDVELKKTYAVCILAGLGLEMILGNVIMLLIGFGQIEIQEWVTNTFFVGMYTQIITLVTIVVKNLFPTKADPISQLSELLKDQPQSP